MLLKLVRRLRRKRYVQVPPDDLFHDLADAVDPEGVVIDGHDMWLRCESPTCDLEVVRPGKVQCNGRCVWPADEATEVVALQL